MAENGPSPSHPRARSGNVIFDHEFIVQTEVRNRQSRDMLTGRLNTAQAHLNKEAIRTAYLALAEADVLRGDLTEAYHAALRAKDYCTNRAQTSQVSFWYWNWPFICKIMLKSRIFVSKCSTRSCRGLRPLRRRQMLQPPWRVLVAMPPNNPTLPTNFW